VHYCELRRGHGTQKEHIEVADKCWDILGTHFPDVVKAVEMMSNED
jgi:thymidylate synthase (FAD)